MSDASLKKIINSDSMKYSDAELTVVIRALKRLADIEYLYHLTKKNKQ